MTCKLTIFLPQFLTPTQPQVQLQSEQLPALTRLLSRADHTTNIKPDPVSALFQLFGFDAIEQEIPHAAVSHTGVVGKGDTNWWIHIDPIHVQVDRNAVVPVAHTELQISEQESEQLIQTLNDHFRDNGWQIEALTTHEWVLTTKKQTGIKTTPLPEVMFHNINDYLPVGTDAIYWHGVMNECQMLFHTHLVNQLRAEQGLPVVNSVWLWGSGALPVLQDTTWQRVFADDFFARGLTITAGVDLAATAELINYLERETDQNLLLVLNDCQLLHDKQGWTETLVQLEKRWFQPLLTRLKNNNINELNFISGDGRCFRITNRALRRWWRKTRTIDYWLNDKHQD